MDDLNLPGLPGHADTPFSRVPVEITVSVGKARPRVRDLLALKGDSVLPLDRRIDDPVELYVGEELIATGELIELEGDAAGQLGGAPDRSQEARRRGMTRLLLTALLALVAVAVPAAAQDMTFSLGSGPGGSLSGTALGLMALLTVLSIVPGLAIMVTCFPLIVTVLSILRQAIGLQQAPPNMLIISLALFLSYFVMEPVFQDAYATGVQPYIAGETTLVQAIPPTYAPFRKFMANRVDPDVLARMEDLRGETGPADQVTPGVLIPSFLLSEIQRAFQIGFLVFLPFMIIDLVTAAVLMSMGMMMVPPAIVSLPFKLAFFVIADGWTLVSQALVKGYM